MRVQTKLMLSTFPILLLGFLSLSFLSYFSVREVIRSDAFRYVNTVLDTRLDQTLRHRESLLRSSKMDKVPSFLALYQQEALQELAVGSDSKYGCFLVLDKQGQSLFKSDGCAALPPSPQWRSSAERARTDPTQRDQGETGGEARRVYGARYFEPWDWVVLYSTEVGHFEQAIKRTLQHTLWLALLCVAACALVVTFLFRRIFVRPVQRLKMAAARIANQERNVQIEVDSRDELGELAVSVNELSVANSDYIDRLERIGRDLEKSNQSMEQEIEVRRNAQTELKTSHDRLMATLNAIPDLMFEVDAEGRIHSYHAPQQRDLYASPEQFLGKTFREILPSGAAEPIMQAIETASSTGSHRGTVYALDLPSGRNWFELSVAAKGELAGPATQFVALVHNITQSVNANERLARNEQELRLITQTIPNMLWTALPSGHVDFCNQSWLSFAGMTLEQIQGNGWMQALHPDDVEATGSKWEQSCRNGERFEVEVRLRSVSGGYHWFLSRAVPLCDANGKIMKWYGSNTDITERKKAEEKVNSLAFYDPLTMLPNRRLLHDRLKQAIASNARRESHGALLFIDLDNFKTVNDTFGHDVGDLLLQQVALRLTTSVRDGDTVARAGGDEFAVVLESLSESAQKAATQAEVVASKILARLSQPYELDGRGNHSTPSIGIALFSQQERIEELMKRADMAMYHAKSAGRNTLRFYEPEMQAMVASRAALEADLREAIGQDQFLLCYQGQAAGDGRLTGAEALLRWRHPERGLVSPAEFIPMAEESDLILPLGQWVLETACKQLASWAAREEMTHLSVAVNVSAKQFRHKDFVSQVCSVLDRTGANPRRLKLELTESMLVEDVENIITKMSALRMKGVGFSLDDFGTGYSSLSYLKRLPLDQLKIDQSFVRDILTDSNDAAIAKMVISVAETMGIAVIAEGVEHDGQRHFLARHGCHAYQGFLFSRPVPLDEFERFAAEKNELARRTADSPAGV